jgi:FixJ family two-component response regulator
MISIIDDDASVREATKSLVLSCGYDALTFASAQQFLFSEHVRHSSCVITDLKMPGMSGAELQERLIADGCEIPVIFITAYADEATRARVLKAGALCFLPKPFDHETLIAFLEKALERRRAGAQPK